MICFLWTLFGYACGAVVLTPTVFLLLITALASFELLPQQSLSLLGIDSSGGNPNVLILAMYGLLSFLFFCMSLGQLFRVISQVKSQSTSVQRNLVPFVEKSGVKQIHSTLGWTKFWLPVEACMRITVPSNILFTLLCCSLATFISGYPGYGICYLVAAILSWQVILGIVSQGEGMGMVATQLDKDVRAIVNNYAYAEAKEEKIKMQKRALEAKREEYQRLIEEQKRRDQAHERDSR